MSDVFSRKSPSVPQWYTFTSKEQKYNENFLHYENITWILKKLLNNIDHINKLSITQIL